MTRNITKNTRFRHVVPALVTTTFFPALEWETFSKNTNWLAGQGSQTGPVCMFSNPVISESSQAINTHGYVTSSCKFEIPIFVNPNILSYEINMGFATLGRTITVSHSFGHRLTNYTDGTTVLSNRGIPSGSFSLFSKKMHLQQQHSTSSYFYAMPVTLSLGPSYFVDAVDPNPRFVIKYISVREISRGRLDVDSGSKDWPSSDDGTMSSNNYIYAQNLEVSNSFLPRKSVLAPLYGTSASIQHGVKQSGLFYWMQPWEITGVLNATSASWNWRSNSTTKVPFSNVSCSIFPSNIYSGQRTGSLDYAFYAYTVGGSSATTGTLTIKTSNGDTDVEFPIGTSRLWFTGSFTGCNVWNTGSNYIPVGNTRCEKIAFDLYRKSGAGTIHIGALLIGEGCRSK